jgi:hypothetical protein
MAVSPSVLVQLEEASRELQAISARKAECGTRIAQLQGRLTESAKKVCAHYCSFSFSSLHRLQCSSPRFPCLLGLSHQTEIAANTRTALERRLRTYYTPAIYDGLQEIKRLRDEEGWEGIYGSLTELIEFSPQHNTVVEVRRLCTVFFACVWRCVRVALLLVLVVWWT